MSRPAKTAAPGARGHPASESRNSGRRKATITSPASIEAHAPHGEKSDFVKVTATLSPEVYRLLADEMVRRKLAKEPNAQLSAILREAVAQYLTPRSRRAG
jgi:hypothetical protein